MLKFPKYVCVGGGRLGQMPGGASRLYLIIEGERVDLTCVKPYYNTEILNIMK